MNDVVFAAAAFITFGAAIFKGRGWQLGSPAARTLVVVLVLLGCALTLLVGPVYRGLDSGLGRTNVAQLIKDLCVVGSACGTQIVLLHLSRARGDVGPRVLTRLLVLGIAAVGMTSAFLVATPGPEDKDYIALHSAQPGVLEFRLIYLAYAAYAFGDIVRLRTRFARLSGDRLLSFGLRLIAWGGGVGILYALVNAGSVLSDHAGNGSLADHLEKLSKALVLVAVLLVVGGSTMPAWAPKLGIRDPGAARRARRAAARIEPLWTALTGALPDVVLDEPAEGGPAPSEKLYRRVIEVEDGRLALRPFQRPEVDAAAREVASARGSTGRDLDAAVEAARLAVALQTMKSGAPAAGGPVAPTRHDAVADVEARLSGLHWWPRRFRTSLTSTR